jgi:hypothetical protein
MNSKTTVGDYSLAYCNYRSDLFTLRVDLFDIPLDAPPPQSFPDKLRSMDKASLPVRLKAHDELTSAAASLLRKIMEVA